MKHGTKRRPYRRTQQNLRRCAPGRQSQQSPVFQPLEPRRLLTTLYAIPDGLIGQTNIFTGWIAMPKFITNTDDIEGLDAGDVESRSVRVRIMISDSNPLSTASVTVLDLDGNALFPWLGQPDGSGGFDTEIEVAFQDDPAAEFGAMGEDGLWGTDDDATVSGFGLDVGYIPGYEFVAGEDETLFTSDDGIIASNQFYPVRVLTWEEEQESEKIADFDFDSGIPGDVTISNIGGGNVNWDTNANIGVSNYTGGESLSIAADVTQGSGAFETAFQFSANLNAWTGGTLKFNLNYQNGGNDSLVVEASTDGSSWTTVKEYTDDVGSFRSQGSGVAQELDLTPFAGNDVQIRFRYVDVDGNALYAQVDDIEVNAFLSGWDTENIPDEATRVIPQTGAWFDPANDLYFRLPAGFENGGTDERLSKGQDGSTWIELDAADHDPWRKPLIDDTDHHRISLPVNADLNPALTAWATANPERARHALGTPDDGIADFNNGIGQIIFNNTSATTTFTIVVIDEEGEVMDPFQLPEESNIGIDIDRVNPFTEDVIQAAAMGQIIIGNPTNADWTFDQPQDDILSFLPYTPNLIGGRNMATGEGWQQWDFQADSNYPDRLAEGISFADPSANETMGNITIDGALFGVSRFPGAVGIMNIGYLGGKIIVDGEMDGLIVAGDAGYIEYSDETTADTGALVEVGRNIGSMIVGGTTSAELSVIGDLNAPADRPQLRVAQSTVIEYEVDLHDFEQLDHNEVFSFGGIRYIIPAGETDAEEADYLTNDTLGTAQFVGRLTGRSEVFGAIGSTPLVGPHTDRDDIDIYSVAVDGRTEMRLQIFSNPGNRDLGVELTIRDFEGNILASRGDDGLAGEIVYTPDKAGLVYIQIENVLNLGPNIGYRLIIQGIEATSLGEYNAYSPMKFVADGSKGIVTKFGSIGTIRAGQDSTEIDNAWMGNLFIDSAGSIWNVMAGGSIGWEPVEGSDIGDGAFISITAANDIGEVLAGIGAGEGDARLGGSIVSGQISAGDDIGSIYAFGVGRNFGDIGGYGVNASLREIDSLITTMAIVAGDSIGVIHADNRIWGGNSTTITYGPQGAIDLVEASSILVDEEHPGNRDLNMEAGFSGIIGNGNRPLLLSSSSPSGSNVKFVRTPSAFSAFNNDDAIIIGPDEVLTLVDDSGAVFTVKVTAGNTSGNASVSAARIITQPVEGSQGVAVARIIANLHFGADLIITNNSGNVEIGDIIVISNGQGTQSRSNIILNGSGKTDVYMIRAVGEFDEIRNTTSGDIIALDVSKVETVKWRGNLGRMNGLLEIGPSLIGPNLGVEARSPTEPAGDDGSGLGLVGGEELQVSWTVGSALQLEPAGGALAFSDLLHGLSVRATAYNDAIELITVGGALGDAVLQTSVERIIVNDDGVTPFGDFNGVEGVVFSNGNIRFINVGDGLLPHSAKGPLLKAGILAVGQVEHVLVEGEGNYIQGAIAGRGLNMLGDSRQDNSFGIGLVEARNGASIRGAGIHTGDLGQYWAPTGSDRLLLGADINKVQLKNGDLFDTIIRAINVNSVSVTGGIWDANLVEVSTNIGRLTADEFRNTTDYSFEFGYNFFGLDNPNAVIASGNVERIETTRRAGDIKDLLVDLQGNLNSIRGFNFDGVILEVDNVLKIVDAKGRIARSQFTTGTVDRIQAQGDIARLSVLTAGPIQKFTSKKGSITQLELTIDGPDAELRKLDAANDLTGSIQVSGPINQIRTKTGDIDAFIRTFSGDGDVKKIQSGGDMLVEMDIDGGIGQLKSGGDLGDGRRIMIRGDAKKIDANKGTIDALFFIEGELGKLTSGDWAASGSISTGDTMKNVVINGNLDGSLVANSGGIDKLTINGRFGATAEISAFEAGIKSLTINGDAEGDIYADKGITKIDIRAANGMAGNLTGSVESANEIKTLTVAGGVTGAYVQALHLLDKVIIGGSVLDTIFGAGETINLIQIAGDARDTYLLAGLEDLGQDNALGGGTVTERDVFTSGNLKKAIVKGGINNVVFAAGVTAGTDGDFATADPNTDLTPGKSVVESVEVSGTAVNGNLVLADTAILATSFSDGADVTETVLTSDDPALPGTGTQLKFSQGSDASFTERDGDTVLLSLNGSGTGTVEYNANGDITGIIFTGTNSRTSVEIGVSTVGGSGNGIVDIGSTATVAAGDDRDLGTIAISGNFTGASGISFDGDINSLSVGLVNTTGTFFVGGHTGAISLNNVLGGTFELTTVKSFDVTAGGFSGMLSSEVITSFVANGDVIDATIFGRDEIGSFRTSGAFGVDPDGPALSPAYIASNVQIGSFSAGSTERAIISAGDYLGNVTIAGDTNTTQFLAGLRLGSDANYGGSVAAADSLTAGTISRITVKGNISQTSVAAGIDPGPDEYFGTGDDLGALGYSGINGITVMGDAEGSNIFSQNFAFISTKEVSNVKVNGDPFVSKGNLETEIFEITAVAPEVVSTNVRLEGKDFVADIFLSEDVSESTVVPRQGSISAIDVASAEGGTDPVQGQDYFISYSEDEQKITVQFERAFIETNPGVYTITIDGSTLVSRAGVFLDGNGDGISGDDYAFNILVGDAGDRTVAGQDWDHDDDVSTDNISFRAASNLDLVLSDLVGSNGTKNRRISVVEILGDHNEHDSVFFPDKMDVDLYEITLEAGDILQVELSALVGSGFLGTLMLRADDGSIIAASNTLANGLIVQADGSYFLQVVGGGVFNFTSTLLGYDLNITDTSGFFDLISGVEITADTISNDIGRYRMDVLIFDDGDTGFDRTIDLDVVAGATQRIEGWIGTEDTIGFASETFVDADAYRLTVIETPGGTPITDLSEGITVTIKLSVEEFGSDLGSAMDVALYRLGGTNINDATFVGARSEFTPGSADVTYTLQLPEDGEYAILVQGSIAANYALEVGVDLTTTGDRYAQARVQNVFLELGGGYADWFGRFGEELSPFSLEDVGFETATEQILTDLVDSIEAKFTDVGVVVNVSTNVTDFGGDEFTTVFLTSDYGEANDFGTRLGISQTLDPLNQDETDEVIIFVNSHNVFSTGQEEEFAYGLGNTIARELGYTFGLRLNQAGDPGYGVMTSAPPVGIPLAFNPVDARLTQHFLGVQNEVSLLEWIFDADI